MSVEQNLKARPAKICFILHLFRGADSPVNNLHRCVFEQQLTTNKQAREQSKESHLGAIHSTKISGLRFENFSGANRSRRVRKLVPFRSQQE